MLTRRRLHGALVFPLALAASLAGGGAARALPEPAGTGRLDLYPRLRRAAPLPPAFAERRASLVLLLDIDEVGQVTRATIDVSSGDPALDEAARQAALRSEFNPAVEDGRPVAARVPWRLTLPLAGAAQAAPAPAAALPAPAVASPVAAPAAVAPAPAAAPPAPSAPASTPAPPTPASTAPAVPFGGRVLRRGNRDPLPGITVALSRPGGPAKGKAPPPAGEPIATATTDAEGRFAFPAVPTGELVVSLSGPRVLPTRSAEKLQAGRRLEVTYYAPVKTSPYEAVVRGETVRKEIVEQTLSVQELRRIPGTQNDAVKAVQNLPGVARAPFGSGLLVVWGSSPADTRTYADGVFIPRVFHFGGLRATVNTEFVQDLSFKPGAYGADYGRGLGGIINITTRSPRSDRIHGSVTLDFIDGSVTLEGPITKKLHVAAGARVSWISVFLPIFNRSNFQISPNYWDYQLAARYRATSRDDLDLFVFGSTDNLSARVTNPDPNASVNIDTKSYFGRARLRWTHRFSPDTVLTVMPSFGGDTFRIDTGDAGIAGRPLKLDVLTLGYNLRSELRHRLLPQLDVSAGLDFEGLRTGFDVVATGIGGPNSSGAAQGPPPLNTAALREATTLHLVQTAPYLTARLALFNQRLIVSPQLRLAIDYFRLSSTGDHATWFNVEPRIFVQGVVIPERLSLKAAAGVYHQPPQGTELSAAFGNPGLLPQFGLTYVAGFDLDLTRYLHLESQAFYKDLRSLVVPDNSLRFLNLGLGRVVGGEVFLRQKLWRGLFGWVAYTLSRSERKNRPEEPWTVFRYDQTHILTVVASYKLPIWGLEAGVRFRYVTGNPTTPVVSGYRNVAEGNYEAIRGAVNSARLPAFHQLDVRIDKTFTFNRWQLGLYLDIQNLYNQANTENLVYGGWQLSQVGSVTGIPFFPNLGVRADF